MPKDVQTTIQLCLLDMLMKVILKILQSRLQQYMNGEFLDVQAGFWRGRGTRDQIANICWIVEKAREFRKPSTASLTRLKPLTMWIRTTWKILKEMGIPDHLTCLLRNLYTGQEATVRTWHEIMDWFKIRKGEWQGCKLSPCLFNSFAEHIIQNAELDKSQAGIKFPGELSITSDMQMIPL